MPCHKAARSIAVLAASALLACAHARTAEPENGRETVAVGDQSSKPPRSDAGTEPKQKEEPKSEVGEAVGMGLFYVGCFMLGGVIVTYPVASAVVLGGLLLGVTVAAHVEHGEAAPSAEESTSSDAPFPSGP